MRILILLFICVGLQAQDTASNHFQYADIDYKNNPVCLDQGHDPGKKTFATVIREAPDTYYPRGSKDRHVGYGIYEVESWTCQRCDEFIADRKSKVNITKTDEPVEDTEYYTKYQDAVKIYTFKVSELKDATAVEL